MPPTVQPQAIRQLMAIAGNANLLSGMLGQQGSGVSAEGSLVLNQGTLFRYPNPTTNAGACTSGRGIEIRNEQEHPVIRAGLITWRNPKGEIVTEAMLAFLDAAGNVRVTCTAAGIRFWKTNGELKSWIAEF